MEFILEFCLLKRMFRGGRWNVGKLEGLLLTLGLLFTFNFLLRKLKSGLLAADVLLGLSFSLLTLKTPCSSEQVGCHALPISMPDLSLQSGVLTLGGAVSVFH